MALSGDDSAGDLPVPPREVSLCVPTSPHARAKRRITALMEEVEALKQDKAVKHRSARSELLKLNLIYLIVGRQLTMFHRDELSVVWLPSTVP
jgi:hypothetical protein